jgi:hypothetical protein
VEDIMIAVLKLLSLIIMALLPWALMKLSNNGEKIFKEAIVNQPLLIAALLLPGVILIIGWIVNGTRK